MINKVCEEMKSFRLEGDVIPISWYENIRKGEKNRKPDLEACLILANIIYWYRPSEIRDESTDKIIGYKQKFKADKLQKSYQQYSDFLGLPKSTIKRAIDNLVKLKLITREFRNFTTNEGLRLTNVMFIEPITENISTISYRKTAPPPQVKLDHLPKKNLDTYTSITTDTTTTIKKEAPGPKHTGTDCSSSDTVDQSVSPNNNKTIDKERQTLIIDLFYKDYEKLYEEKLELNPKEIGCIGNLLKKDKDSFKKKYDLLLNECKKEKNTFFKLTPSILLYSWNQLVEIKKETWEERMERIKKGDLHYE